MDNAVFDPLGRRWILLAPARAGRKGGGHTSRRQDDPSPCDFCGGMEDKTPPETCRAGASGSWRVRAFPNLFPGTRFHEVVVHSPEHDSRFELLEPAHRIDVVRTWGARFRAAHSQCVIVAMNRGPESGASRSHEHSQIFGLDLVPPVLERESEAFLENPAVLYGMVSEELVVERSGGFTLATHPAPSMARELLIFGDYAPNFSQAVDSSLNEFAQCLAGALVKLDNYNGKPTPLNLVIHSAPTAVNQFHWHAHIYPRLSVPGALEIGAELPLVAADPVEVTDELRHAE